MMSPFQKTCASVVLLTIILVGCKPSGPKQWPISGRVTFQGQPVAQGCVRFSNPQLGSDFTTFLKSDGTYTLVTSKGPGLREGEYAVAIMPPPADMPFDPTQQPPKPQSYPSIPQKYRDPTTSGLTTTIKAEANHYNIDMQPAK